jgi:glutathione synthase
MLMCVLVNRIESQRDTYTTAHLCAEAVKRGHHVWVVGVDDLSYDDAGEIHGLGTRFEPHSCADTTELVGRCRDREVIREQVRLNDADLVFIRCNPAEGASKTPADPVIVFGQLLKRAGVIVLNDPDGLALARSKMYLSMVPHEIRPRTLVSRSYEQIRRFIRDVNGACILKPLHGYGGENVFYVGRRAKANIRSMLEAIRKTDYVIAQEYLPEVTKGDKRVLLLGGDPIYIEDRPAVYKRMQPRDDHRNNMHIGGIARRARLSETDLHICSVLKPRLNADGLYFVGVDIVGEKVLEVNVFAPGGIDNINRLQKINVGDYVIADLESKVALRKAYHGTVKVGTILKT